MKDMTGRVVKAGIHFDYVLNDSWFTCTDLVRYVRRIHNGCEYLGMIKMSKRHYAYRGKLHTAKTLAEMLWKKNRHGRHRKYGYSFVYANVMMDDQKVRLFLTRKSKRSEWRRYLGSYDIAIILMRKVCAKYLNLNEVILIYLKSIERSYH
jgi:hypothetical protein